MAMLVTLCWGLQSVVDLITQTARWEVVKICASPKRLFFIVFPVLRAFPVQIGKCTSFPCLKFPPPLSQSTYVYSDIIILLFLNYQTLPYMTDIKEPINTTSDGAFLSVVCEKPKKKCCWPKVGGAVAPPSPPRNYPLLNAYSLPLFIHSSFVLFSSIHVLPLLIYYELLSFFSLFR